MINVIFVMIMIMSFSFSFSFDCYVCRHQIQHYTGQLAKDTSSQLKELNSYPPEQALDPRCIS